MDFLVGIDIGTTGVKILAMDFAGRVAGTVTVEYPLSTPKPGWAEQDPKLWWDATAKGMQLLWKRSKVRAADVKGVGLSGQMHGLVALDGGRRVLRPAILWCDQRTHKECDIITRKLGDRLRDELSNPALAGFTAPKLLWMKRNEPRLYAAMRTMLLPKDYVRLLLTGEAAMDVSDAAGTLLFNVARREWAVDAMRAMGLRTDVLPPVMESAAVAGRVTREAARATGLPEGTPVVAGGADNTCAAVGTGIVREGRVSSSIGSSGVIFAHTDTLRMDPLMRVHSFNHSVPGRWYLMGVMLSAGLSFRWFRDTFGDPKISYDKLTAEAAEAPAGCEGLLFLPYLNGERTPHADPFARGVFFGISHRHDRRHFARAVMEGIVFGLRDSLDIMRECGFRPKEVRATGGGGKSAFWRQMQADVFECPVATVGHDEGPAFGAGLLAGVGVGAFDDVAAAADSTVRVNDAVKPNPELRKVYRAAHGRYKELYAALRGEFGKIKIQE